MESIMSNPRIILRTIAAAAVGTAVVVSTAQAANTKASFRDVLQPNGQTRSTAEKFADGAACGMSPGHHIRVIMPVFEQCMAGKGWAFDHYQPDPSSRPRSGTTVNFTDTRGDANSRPRGNAALQADTRTCKAGHLDEESWPFKQCMATHGWQFMYAQSAPRPHLRAAPEAGSGRSGVRHRRVPAPVSTMRSGATMSRGPQPRPRPMPSTPRTPAWPRSRRPTKFSKTISSTRPRRPFSNELARRLSQEDRAWLRGRVRGLPAAGHAHPSSLPKGTFSR